MQRSTIVTAAGVALTLAACGSSAAPRTPSRPDQSTGLSGDWHQITTARTPAPRDSALIAYDSLSRSILLAGGKSSCTGGPDDLQDTWSWNGNGWIELHPAMSFPPRLGSGNPVAYDAASGDIISLAFPGCGQSTSTLRWDGSTWALENNEYPAPANTGTMAYDPTNQAVILWSPQPAVTDTGVSSTPTPTTWAYTGGLWTELKPAVEPPASLQPAVVAYDADASQLILYSERSQQTWSWNGRDWRRLRSTLAPSPRIGASVAYDASIGSVVLFGGAIAATTATASTSPQPLNDLWRWTGEGWQQLHPATPPPPRYDTQMTFDATSDQMIIFGGSNGTAADLSDTWVLTTSG